MTKDTTINNTFEQDVPNTLLNIKGKINQELNTPLSIAKEMAQNPYILSFLKNKEPQRSLSGVTEYLEQTKTSFNASTSFLVSKTTGNYYTGQGVSKQISKTKLPDKWFYTFLSSSKEYEFNLDYDHNRPNVLMVYINYKIKDKNNKTTAVTGIGLSMDKMAAIIEDFAFSNDGEIYLINAESRIAVAKEHALVGLKLDQIFPQAKTLLAKKSFASSELNDGEKLLATDYIPSLNWHVALIVSKNKTKTDF